MTQTIAECIAQGQHCLARLRNAEISPSTQMYASLAQEAIASTLTAIAMILDGQERPSVPGLPKGYQITTEQTGNGNRKWRYAVTGPRLAYSSRYRYDTSDTALTAGLRHARDDAAVPSGLDPLLEAAREGQALNEPVHLTPEPGWHEPVSQNLTLADQHTAYGEPLPGTGTD